MLWFKIFLESSNHSKCLSMFMGLPRLSIRGFKFSKSLRQCGRPCFILKQSPQPLFTNESDHSSGLAIMGIVLYFIHENFKKIGFFVRSSF